jgi:sulfate adenylyltransferase
MITPHGGQLINKRASEKQKKELLKNVDYKWEIDEETAKDIINIADGVYSPLEGFQNEDDFVSVTEKKMLANGVIWSIPKYLNVPKSKADDFTLGSDILLYNDTLGVKAVLSVESKYTYPRDKYCSSVFKTTDKNHPGVIESYKEDEVLIGGDVYLIEEQTRLCPKYNIPPAKTREIFTKNDWKSIVGFQTRNPAHLAHEFIQKMALEFVDGLFINPIIGRKKSGDFRDEVILNVYEQLTANYYPQNSTVLGVFPAKMNYAGPREAILHAIARKNYGCTHFIVGRDHAGVGDYYGSLEAQEIFEQIEDIEIQIFKFSHAFYSKKSRMFTTQKVSPFADDNDRIAPSGTKVRALIKEKNIDELEKFMRKEVIDIILSYKQPFVS